MIPSKPEMYEEIEHFRAHPSQKSPAVLAVEPLEYADEIAALAGVSPRLWHHPGIVPRWYFGPFSAAHYRLDGPGRKL